MVLVLVFLAATANAAERFGEPVDVEFVAECDGSVEKYVLLVPEGIDKPRGLMVALHGHGSDRWQFATSDTPGGTASRAAALKYDLVYVSPDYRAKTSWMGPKAEADVVQIIKAVKEQFGVENTIIVGGSMGGSSSLSFAAMHPNLIQGVVSFNGTANHLEYENYQDAIIASFGGTKQEIPEEYKRRSAEYWPERLTMPVAVTTGGQDTSVPPDSCTRLVQVLTKLNPNVFQLHRPEGGHSTTHDDSLVACEFVCERVFINEQSE